MDVLGEPFTTKMIPLNKGDQYFLAATHCISCGGNIRRKSSEYDLKIRIYNHLGQDGQHVAHQDLSPNSSHQHLLQFSTSAGKGSCAQRVLAETRTKWAIILAAGQIAVQIFWASRFSRQDDQLQDLQSRHLKDQRPLTTLSKAQNGDRRVSTDLS